MKYVIDPFLFAYSDKMSANELDDYVDYITTFDDWWSEHKDDVYVLSSMGDMMYEKDLYPLVDRLAPLLESLDSDYEYRDISRMLNHYIDHTNFIDEASSNAFIGCEKTKFNKPVGSSLSHKDTNMKDALFAVLWQVFCSQLLIKDDAESYVVFTKDIDETLDIHYDYEYVDESVDSDDFQHAGGDIKINCHSSLSSFLNDGKTPVLLWRFSTCKKDLDLGLRCYVMQFDNLSCIDEVNERYSFVLQDSFYEDFCDNNYANRPKDITSALDSMTKAVKNIHHGKPHNMRTGPGANDPYLYHGQNPDKYSGMRKNVTTSIKLHYWKRDPYYRFAKIGEHDHFDLPWGD